MEKERADLLARVGILRNKGCVIPFDVNILTINELSAVYNTAVKKFEDNIKLTNAQKAGSLIFILIESLINSKISRGLYATYLSDIELLTQTTKIEDVDVCIKVRCMHIRDTVTTFIRNKYENNTLSLDSHGRFIDVHTVGDIKLVMSVIDMFCTDDTLHQKMEAIKTLLPEEMILFQNHL